MILLLFFISAVLSKSIQPNKLDQTESYTNLKNHDHNKKFKIKVTGSGIVELQPTIGTVIFPIEFHEKYAIDAVISVNTLLFDAVMEIKRILKKNTKLDDLESLQDTERVSEGKKEKAKAEWPKSDSATAYNLWADPPKAYDPKRADPKAADPKYVDPNAAVTKVADEPKKDQGKHWSQGIEPEFHEDYSIETGKQQISMIYDNSTGVQEYSVTNQLYITTKHVQLIKEIIFEGVSMGLFRVDGVNYSNNQKEIDKAKDKALKLAIKDAKRKAKQIARSLNLQFHEVLNFKYLDNQNNATTDLCDPKAAEMLNQATCIPIQSAKKYVRVDVELSVLLKQLIKQINYILFLVYSHRLNTKSYNQFQSLNQQQKQ